MTSKLGCHWMRVHPDGQDLQHVERMQYPSVKLFEWHWSDADACSNLLSVLPRDSYILARDHPLSEQEIWSDPVGIGTRHANEWADKVHSGRYKLPTDRSFFLGRNEPDATTGDRNAIDLYTEAFLRRLAQHGLRGGAFNFSTGHPRTVDGTGNTGADYSVFERSHRAIVDGHHIGVLHIYGTAETPCIPGHFDRLRSCDWQDVQWVVGEMGIDEWLNGGGEHIGYKGPFNGHLNDYCGWLDTLIMGINDARIHSYQVFTYDFSHPWSSFDVRDIRSALESYQWQHMTHAPTKPTTPPVTTHLPSVGTGTPVPAGDNWQRAWPIVLDIEGGLSTDPNDRGNYKPDGTFVGTKYGISANAHPDVDIVNLTKEQALAIYKREYWDASGADRLEWPLALAHFDLAVNGGVGRARQALSEAGQDFDHYNAWRLRWYTGLDQFDLYGRAWVRRVATIMEAGAP